jgi:HEAT repeat protein
MIRLLYDSKDRESSRLLSSIIKEESNPLRLRCAAYLGLLQIQGMNISTDLALAIHHAKNILPKEVDIALVDSFVS